jgi:hypothetical protein
MGPALAQFFWGDWRTTRIGAPDKGRFLSLFDPSVLALNYGHFLRPPKKILVS